MCAYEESVAKNTDSVFSIEQNVLAGGIFSFVFFVPY
jgi:hypothetical protein